MSSTVLLSFLLSLLLACGCLGEESQAAKDQVGMEADQKAMESEEVTRKAEPATSGSESSLRRSPGMLALPSSHAPAAPHQPKVMIMPPVSLMIAMPHPSGRFLMLFPATQLMPIIPMPYTHQQQHQHQPQHEGRELEGSRHHQDHPAFFAARQQMLYGGYQPQQQQQHQQPYRQEADRFPGHFSPSLHPYQQHSFKRIPAERDY